ncbi:hypothetical protein GOODEAATRI_014949 [Goodea atripinnis]|uniref:Uncharacterized protein n=1 Tax=Goodea atripinnis TaxID=208336 RepID=A0ABV0MV31_9TELE
MQPRGTPVEDTTASNSVPFTLTHCVQFVRRSISHKIKAGSTLLYFSHSASMRGWMELKANEKSIKSNSTKVFAPLRWVNVMLSKVAMVSFACWAGDSGGEQTVPYFCDEVVLPFHLLLLIMIESQTPLIKTFIPLNNSFPDRIKVWFLEMFDIIFRK